MSCAKDQHAMLDVLMPMHLVLDERGRIVHAGPTLTKLRPGGLTGRLLQQVFTVRRPQSAAVFSDLVGNVGSSLHLNFSDPPGTSFKGVMVRNVQGSGYVLNLSFGISIVAAIGDYDLGSADFSPTDLAVELLYLNEAKSAMMEESRRLNVRLRAAHIAAEEQAFTDTLTGLKNRRALHHVQQRFRQVGRSYGLIHLDLDRFKAVNDIHGHAAGDHVLQEVAQRMLNETRKSDVLVRIGGDEFLIVLPDVTDRNVLVRKADRIIAALERPVSFGNVECLISASAGVAVEDGRYLIDEDELIRRADAALYASKRAGRGRTTTFGSTG